jgi:predicted aspartyl protease
MIRLASIGWLMLVAAATVLPGRSANAEDCAAPQSTELAIRLLHDEPLVAVAIDGKPATLLLDTGAEETMLGTGAAARLGLVGHYEYPRRVSGLGGGGAPGVAATRNFAVGSLDVTGFGVMIGGVALPDVEGIQLDGLLGADFLAEFAVDLDVPDSRLRLYRRQCVTAAPRWPPPFVAVAANRSLHEHLFFPVILDGRRLYAFIDTGAQRSLIDRDAALALGSVTAADLDRGPNRKMRGATAAVVSATIHRFGRLQVGDIAVRDPVFAVTPLNLVDADIILGEDFIEPRRIWLSYDPPQIFIKDR